MARISLRPWKFVLNMDSSGHLGLIVTQGQEANGDNVGNVFDLRDNNGMLCVLIRIASSRRF